jgi:hypothetical protein
MFHVKRPLRTITCLHYLEVEATSFSDCERPTTAWILGFEEGFGFVTSVTTVASNTFARGPRSQCEETRGGGSKGSCGEFAPHVSRETSTVGNLLGQQSTPQASNTIAALGERARIGRVRFPLRAHSEPATAKIRPRAGRPMFHVKRSSASGLMDVPVEAARAM